jgi:hypothetical protein
MSMLAFARTHALAFAAAAILSIPLSTRAAAPVTVSAFANNGTVGNSITLQGRATDADCDLSYLNFYITGPGIPPWSYLGSGRMSGCDATTTWSYTPPAAGAYTMHIRAFDFQGNPDSNANVTYAFTVADNSAPTTVSATASGPYAGQPFTLTGRATDVDGNLSSMNFYITGPNIPPWSYLGSRALSGSDSTASISYTPPVPGGYTMHIRAFDSMGVPDSNANVTYAFSVASSNAPPVTVSASASNAFVGQQITLTGRATDVNADLSSMDFYLAGPGLSGWVYMGSAGLSGGDYTASLTLGQTFDVPGWYAVHVRAHDAAGNMDSNANIAVGFPVKAKAQILVDVNQMNACEAGSASSFAANGAWTILYNSPDLPETSPSWAPTLGALNAATFAITEDDHEPWTIPFQTVDRVAAVIGRMPDAAMIYHETNPGFDFGSMPMLSYDEITAAANHVVPGFGPLGARVVVLTRMYEPGYPPRDWVNAALANPNTYGVAFESLPDPSGWPTLDMAGGLRACLNAGRKCFMLLPPPAATSGLNFLTMFQNTMKFFEQNQLLGNPNLYIVPAAYVRAPDIPSMDTAMGFLPNACGYSAAGRSSVSDVVHWLQSYVGGTAQ